MGWAEKEGLRWPQPPGSPCDPRPLPPHIYGPATAQRQARTVPNGKLARSSLPSVAPVSDLSYSDEKPTDTHMDPTKPGTAWLLLQPGLPVATSL